MSGEDSGNFGGSIASPWVLVGRAGSGSGGTDVQYHIHKNVAYLEGAIRTTDGSAYTYFPIPDNSNTDIRMLLTVPAAIIPPADTAVTMQVIATYGFSDDLFHPIDSNFAVPSGMTGVIHTDGTLTMDTLPPWCNTPPTDPNLTHQAWLGGPTPTGGVADVAGPLIYWVILGGVSWSLGAATPLTQTWQTLAPYLGSNWADIDAEYSAGGARLELRGHIEAVTGGAGTPQPILASLPGPPDLLSGRDWTVVTHPGFSAPVQVINPHASMIDDTQYVGPTGLDKANLYLPVQYPSYAATPWRYRLPIDPADISSGGLAAVDGWSLQTWHPLLEATPTEGAWTGDPRSTIAGLNTNFDSYGAYYCDNIAAEGPGGRRAKDRIASLTAQDSVSYLPYTSTPASGALSASMSVAAILASYYPAPDWVALVVYAWGSGFGGMPWNSLGLTLTGGGTLLDLSDWTTPVAMSQTKTDGSYPMIAGYLSGGSTAYTRDPHNPASGLVWLTSEVPDTWTADLAWDIGTLGFETSASFSVNLALDVVPFWECRQNVVVAGDVVTLDGAGWQIPYGSSPTIMAGPAGFGAIPRTRPV